MIDKSYTYAIIWASNNTEKYGFKVFKDLKEAGYKVVPINPNEKNNILGEQVFATLHDVPTNIDVVIFVVPPKITENILQEVKKMGITKVWMQPWAESKSAIQYCEKEGIECIHNACIMIQKNQ